MQLGIDFVGMAASCSISRALCRCNSCSAAWPCTSSALVQSDLPQTAALAGSVWHACLLGRRPALSHEVYQQRRCLWSLGRVAIHQQETALAAESVIWPRCSTGAAFAGSNLVPTACRLCITVVLHKGPAQDSLQTHHPANLLAHSSTSCAVSCCCCMPAGSLRVACCVVLLCQHLLSLPRKTVRKPVAGLHIDSSSCSSLLCNALLDAVLEQALPSGKLGSSCCMSHQRL